MEHTHYYNLKAFRNQAIDELEHTTKRLQDNIANWEEAMGNYLSNLSPDEAHKLRSKDQS